MDQGKAGIHTKITVDTLADLSDEYLRLAPGTERNTWLIEKFGRSGLQMARLMETGGEKIREMSEAIEDDLILTEDAIKVQEEYRVAVDELEDAVSGLKTQLGLALMPLKTEWNQFLVQELIPVLREVIGWFKELPVPAQAFIVALVLIGGAAAKAAPGLVGVAAAFNILGGAGGLAGIGTAITGSLLPALAGIGTTIVGAVLSPIGLLIAAIGLLIYTIATMGPAAWKSISLLWSMLVNVIKRMWYDIKTWGVLIGKAFVTGIGVGITESWEWLKNLVANLAQTILQAAKDALEEKSDSKASAREVGKPLAQGIGVGFSQAIPELVAQIQMALSPVPAMAMAGMSNVRVGHIEYHGSFSREELNRLDRRSERIASRSIEEVLR